MTIENLTEQDIKDLIIEFNLDESINDLKRYYSTPTTWEIINQSRKETSHTQFLAWFFGNKDFNADPNAGPIKKLIVLLLKWANKQVNAAFDKELANSIYSQSLSILSYDVSAESPIFIEPYKEGYIDILVKCVAKVNNKVKNINIAIENKIGAPETIKPFNKTKLYQTEAYHQYITKTYNNNDDINLFVFLKPTDRDLEYIKQAECKCDKYIQINYQEILDNIIQPVSDQKDISVENKYRLKDYIKTLGKPAETDDDTNKNIIIMAMEQKERELLTTFFKNNEDLIRAAINALGDEELSKSMESFNRKTRSKYSINGEGCYSMYEVLEKFVEFRLTNTSDSVQDIDKEIAGFVKSKSNSNSSSKDAYVSDTQKRVIQENKKPHGTFTFNGRKIRYTKQWSDGGSNPTFTRFRQGVSGKYPNDFKIDVI